MSMRLLLWEGKACNREGDLEAITRGLRRSVGYLHSLCVDDIIGFLDAAGSFWMKEFGKGNPEVKHAAETLSKQNLTAMVETALRDRRALDGFVKLKGRGFYHAQPRGLVVHWVAGNVPLLGLFSVFQAMVTKNASLVKASSRENKELVKLLASLSRVNTGRVRGRDMLKSVAVVTMGRDDREAMEGLSMAADVRIAWGGQEAVDSIMGLMKRFSTVDVIHGPKYSYALIGRECLQGDVKPLARRLAVDASLFDQYACSSPHTVFAERGGEVSPRDFAKELAEQMGLVNRMLFPKGRTSPDKVMDILSIRAKYALSGEVFSPEGPEWTVVYSEEEGLADACFSRVVFVRPLDDPGRLEGFNNRNKQTLGIEMPRERRLGLLDRATLRGVDRCPRIGGMSLYESPWDGEFVMDRMVRWVTSYE